MAAPRPGKGLALARPLWNVQDLSARRSSNACVGSCGGTSSDVRVLGVNIFGRRALGCGYQPNEGSSKSRWGPSDHDNRRRTRCDMTQQMLSPAASAHTDRPRPRTARGAPDIARDKGHADYPRLCHHHVQRDACDPTGPRLFGESQTTPNRDHAVVGPWSFKGCRPRETARRRSLSPMTTGPALWDRGE